MYSILHKLKEHAATWVFIASLSMSHLACRMSQASWKKSNHLVKVHGAPSRDFESLGCKLYSNVFTGLLTRPSLLVQRLRECCLAVPIEVSGSCTLGASF